MSTTLTTVRNHATVSQATKDARLAASLRAAKREAALERDVEVAEIHLRNALARMLAARGLPGVKRVIKASTLELADNIRCVAGWES